MDADLKVPSGKPLIANLEPFGYSAEAESILNQVGAYLAQPLEALTPDNRARVAALIVRFATKMTPAVMETFPRLRWIVSATTGTDHIDVKAAALRGIEVLCLKGEREFLASIPSTAEHTWALLLALVRRIPAATASVAAGHWDRDQFRGAELKGKTLGIIGLGRTGSKVASYAEAFGMTVGYYDPFQKDESYRRFDSIVDLLSWSDVVSVHVHLTNETEGLLGREDLAAIKPGARLVNTSRGRIIDESAAADLIENGTIVGLATDVLTTELDAIADSPLHRLVASGANVIITPHIGGATWDAMHTTEEFMAKKLAAAIEADRALAVEKG